MFNCRWRLFVPVLTSTLLSLSFCCHANALDCYTDSPSVEEGRTIFEKVRPRDLVDGEHQDLQVLLASLKGRWSGILEVESCREIDDEVITETEEFSFKSKIEWSRNGRFSISSSLRSEEKRTTHPDRLYLCLGRQRLATVCNLAASNIELLSAASDSLKYVEKFSKKPNRLQGEVGSINVREVITAIRKDSPSAFTLEKLVYYQGKLIAKENWQFEME